MINKLNPMETAPKTGEWIVAWHKPRRWSGDMSPFPIVVGWQVVWKTYGRVKDYEWVDSIGNPCEQSEMIGWLPLPKPVSDADRRIFLQAEIATMKHFIDKSLIVTPENVIERIGFEHRLKAATDELERIKCYEN